MNCYYLVNGTELFKGRLFYVDILFIVTCSVFIFVGENTICVGVIFICVGENVTVLVVVEMSSVLGVNVICVNILAVFLSLLAKMSSMLVKILSVWAVFSSVLVKISSASVGNDAYCKWPTHIFLTKTTPLVALIPFCK